MVYSTKGITYLNTNFHNKDEAKQLGAIYDGNIKTWYTMRSNPNHAFLVKNHGRHATKEEYDKYMKKLNKPKQPNYIDDKAKEALTKSNYQPKRFNKYLSRNLSFIDPTVKHLKNVKYDGKDIIAIKAKTGKYTIDEIQKMSNKFSKKLQKKGVNGLFMTTLEYGKIGWRSGYFKDVGNDVDLYDPDLYYDNNNIEKPKTIDNFYFFLKLDDNKIQGGDDDKFNDCLYVCLKYYIFDIKRYYKDPAALKSSLGLKRADKIPGDMIDKIEKHLKTYQINVRGDWIRTSSVKSHKQININLINEHYTVEKSLTRPNLTPNLKYKEKHIVLYDQRTFEGYDGKNKWTLSKKEKNAILCGFKTEYILFNRQQYRDEEGNIIEMTIEDEYIKLDKIARTLKLESNELINLYKSGGFKNSALDLFDRTTKFLEAEPLLQDESIWIKSCSFSSLIWAEKYKGPVYKYDVKSMFPHLMKSSQNSFPIKRGEFEIITELPTILKFGIYRCEIKPSDDKNINKLFRYNKKNFYTQLDIYNARELNLKINLIQDNKVNLLYYSSDKLIKFCEVFTNYVDILFDLKEKKIECSKDILNILWGGLCETNKNKHFVETKFDMDDDEYIEEIYPSKADNEKFIIKTTKLNNYYKTPFARLCPFLLSKSRTTMSKIMFPHREHIHRINVDGFYMDKIFHENQNVKLGELKYEGQNLDATIEGCTNKIKVHY